MTFDRRAVGHASWVAGLRRTQTVPAPYHVTYYGRNAARLRVYHKKERAERRSLLVAFVDAAHAGGCVDCGMKNLSVLQSDHVRGKKFRTLSSMIDRNVSLRTLFAELDKCETRCANCHFLATRRRRLAA